MGDDHPKDGSTVDPDNIIAVMLEDLSEEDRREIEQELEEDRLKNLQKKLAGLRKTRNNAVYKVAVPASSASPSTEVSAPLSEEIGHLIDALVASKYGTQIENLTHTLNDSLFGKFDEFKLQFNQDIVNSLPRQVRSAVLQARDQNLEKQPVPFENTNSAELPNAAFTVNASASTVQPNVTLGDYQSGRNYVSNSANNFAPNFAPSATNSAVVTSVPQPGNRVVNFNLQQPYYQTASYTAPSLPSMGTGVPYGPVSNMYPNVSPQHVPHAQPLLPKLQLHNNVASMPQTSSLEPPQNFKDQIANVLRELGLEPKGKARAYQKPYLEYVDSTPYPRGFKILDFVKFMGEDGRSTFEHIGQFLAQISEVGTSDVYKLKLFPLSLSGTAFTWFSSLAPKSIVTWAQLEQKFHEYFYSGETELRLTDLILVKQKYNESVSEYIRRFRDVKNRCFSLIIAEKDLADIAFSGLLAHIKDRLEGQQFSDINQVLQKSLA